MSDDLHTLAAAVVQSPWWRWMPGMRFIWPDEMNVKPRLIGDDGTSRTNYSRFRWDRDHERDDYIPDGAVPDLQDPATLGCLLALVREAWGDPNLVAVWIASEEVWIMARGLCNSMLADDRYYRGASEPAALVAALLAAPPPAR